jgi:VIT1/CCC1 family predicted Fe2+/Mn2+ transporter
MEIEICTFSLYMLAGAYMLGFLTFIIGVAILLIGVWGYDQKNLLAQTNQIAQKGIAEDISGLVGNASMLVTAIHDMVRTRNGVGILLLVTGVILMIAAYWFTSIYGIC